MTGSLVYDTGFPLLYGKSREPGFESRRPHQSFHTQRRIADEYNVEIRDPDLYLQEDPYTMSDDRMQRSALSVPTDLGRVRIESILEYWGRISECGSFSVESSLKILLTSCEKTPWQLCRTPERKRPRRTLRTYFLTPSR